MTRRRRGHSSPARADGFALPLAIVLLLAVSLIAGLLLDAALGQLRTAGAELGQARAESAAETALAAALAFRVDSAALALPPGTVLSAELTGGPDTVATTLQLLVAPFARIVARAVVTRGRLRVSAGRHAVVVFAPDSLVVGELRLLPARGPWWVPVP